MKRRTAILRRTWLATSLTLGLAFSIEFSASAGELERVAPAPEKKVEGATQKPALSTFRSTVKGAAGRPVLEGRALNEQARAKMKAEIDARIERDVNAIKKLRDEAASLLEEFVKESSKDTPDLPEALMRLGELRWEIEREAAVARFEAWEKKPVDQRGPAPEPNFEPARALFQRVLQDYPRQKDYDLALYIDGFLATEQGRPEEALLRFERILKDFPKSRFVPDAHMSRAESLFGKGDYPGSLAEYEEVLKFKGSDLYGLALFKSAWCMWRLGRTEEAAKRFVSVFEIAEGKTKDASQQKQLDELQSESLKYLVEVFTEDDKNSANDVYNFLTRIGGDRFAGKVVKALAEQFFDQAHYERGTEAYELLLKLDPTNRDAGLWVLRMAEGLNLVEDWPKLKATYERAVRDYTTGGAWSKTQADPAAVAETTTRIEHQLREHALNLHAKAQKDKTSKAEFDGARDLYAVYLSRFSSEPKAYQVAYYAAEIEFYHLGKNTDAATHYMMAARGVPDAEAQKEPLKTLRHDALFNAIASLERVRVAELEAKKKQPKGEGKDESEIDVKFAEALDLYAQLYPNDPSLPELFYRQGKLYYDYGVYDPAVKIWGAMLEKFPRSKDAQAAGELLLDSFNKSKNYENIEIWARRLKGVPAFQSAAQQDKLNLLIVQAVFKQGEQKANAGDHSGAGAAYLRAAKEFPKDARAAQACVNAELEAQKAGDLKTLKEAAMLVIGPTYRERPEAPQGAWIAVTTFQAMGLFSDAAEFSEGLVASAEKGHTKSEHTKDAAFNAVLLRAAVGENDKAVQNGQKYLASFGSTQEADEVVFQMGRAHQRAGHPKEAIELYKRYLPRAKNQDHRAQGYVLLAEAQFKSGDEKGGEESLRQAVQLGKQKRGLGPDGKYAAAHARYMEGERVLAKFAKVQIEGDVKQLSKRLKEKAELLKQAATIFLDTVSLGVAEWSTAALYQIGNTYESFAKALRDAPPPSNLSEADKELYQQQIDEFVVPIEEKSLDAFENGWKKAIELGIYNQWTAKMRDGLGRLNGELYRPFKEVGFEVRSSSAMSFPGLIETPRRGGEGDKKSKELEKGDDKAAKDEKSSKGDEKKPDEKKGTDKKGEKPKKTGKGAK